MILYNFKICQDYFTKKRILSIFYQIIPKEKNYCITKFKKFKNKNDMILFLKRLKSNKKYQYDKIITWLDYD